MTGLAAIKTRFFLSSHRMTSETGMIAVFQVHSLKIAVLGTRFAIFVDVATLGIACNKSKAIHLLMVAGKTADPFVLHVIKENMHSGMCRRIHRNRRIAHLLNGKRRGLLRQNWRAAPEHQQ